jgi:hypothetical protein
VASRKSPNHLFEELHKVFTMPSFFTQCPGWDSKGQPKEWKWKCLMGKKNINGFYVNFARARQDHTFSARIHIETPGDSQRNENGKCLMVKKNTNDF